MATNKRLIDANKLSEQMAVTFEQCVYDGVDSAVCQIALDTISEASTVDAVEVVRCKDCKHCYKALIGSSGYRCKIWGVYDTDCEVAPEHFCSYGERKTMAECFAGGHLRFCSGTWRDDNGDPVEIRKVVHGRWIPSKSMVLSDKCSVCHGWVTRHSVNEREYRYCPHCGAKMDLKGG